MMQALLHLIAKQPHLLADHAEAYADLLGQELGLASAQWKRRTLLSATALCCAGVGAVLVGVALMLWAVVPPDNMNAPWALVVAPLVPLVAAAACLAAARARPQAGAFDSVRRQLREDVAMLREASAT
ncbi:MAG: phage holin family protein [Rhizobacter sp.]|nr:phage holin family protein [Rhizobacter sp.]